MSKLVVPTNVHEIIPLTNVQEGMIYHHLKDQDNDLYFDQIALKLQGVLDVQCLIESFQEVIANNEGLRTVFKWENLRRPVQIIVKDAPLKFQYIERTEKSELEQQEALEIMLAEQRQTGFQYGEECLYRASLISYSNQLYHLVLHYHHIMMDGWSLSILLQELFETYNRRVKKLPAQLKKKAALKTYHKWRNECSVEAAKTYWRSYLSDFETSDKLLYRSENKAQDHALNEVVLDLPIDLEDDLRKLSIQLEITWSDIICFAWAMLLRRYTNRGDITFGLTVSGRGGNVEGIQEMIGMFINTIPLRVKFNDEMNVQETLVNLHRNIIESKNFEYASLSDIKSVTPLKGQEQLFHTIVVVENYPLDHEFFEHAINGIKILDYFDREKNNYDLSLVFLTGKKSRIKIEYNDSLFSCDFVNKLAEHYLGIIGNISGQLNDKISEVKMLSDQDKLQLHVHFNQTADEYPLNLTVPEMFVQQAQRTPDLVAVKYGSNELTYRELDHHSARLAQILLDKGVSSNDIVAVMLDWSVEIIEVPVGVLRAGAAYLPIDPGYPQARIMHTLNDSGAVLLITHSSMAIKLINYSGEIIYIDQIDRDSVCHNELAIKPDPHDLSYIIYTSGSTGLPKGVMVEHRSFIEFTTWAIEEYDHRVEFQVLLSNSFAFDSSILLIFPTITSGGTLHLIHPDTRKDSAAYYQYLKDHRINHIDEVPVIMSVLFEYLESRQIEACLPAMEQISLGSEYVPIELVRKCRKLNQKAKIVNGYGPAEASVIATTYLFDGNDQQEISLIGKPRRNTEIHILGIDGEACPIGVPGEICISGVVLARGYINRPELTAEKFCTRIINNKPQRVYKTGDLGRWTSDGNIEFIGRSDQQIKIRGYRIELMEIENVLLKHASIQEAIVITRTATKGDLYIAAYLVVSEPLTQAEVKVFLSKMLPDYMIPRYVVFLDKFPLNPNSKVDRSALPDPLPLFSFDAAPPKSAVEQQIAGIWKDILDIDEIDIYSNFFEIGGDSIQLTRVFNKLKGVFSSQQFQISDLFTYSSISQLADFLSQSPVENGINPIESTDMESDKKDAVHIPAANPEDIAIIGIGIRVPQADTLEQFWTLLKDGRSVIDKKNEHRISHDPKNNMKLGYLEYTDRFNNELFQIPEQMARIMDSGHKIMLEVVHSAIDNAGYNKEQLHNRPIGVFMSGTQAERNQHSSFNAPANLGGRVSYHFGLTGPTMVIDTANSSSLSCLHTASSFLRSGECEAAIVGGINLRIDPIDSAAASEVDLFSKEGVCRAFSDDADGMVGGEGCIALLIKPLQAALQDRNYIHAIIRGSSVTHQGAISNGISSPSPEAQTKTLMKAWHNANVEPATISYFEAHGTGTLFGDAIEIKAISDALKSFQVKTQSVPIGSVNPNIGHLERASGLASVVKTVLCLKHKQFVPSINYTSANRFAPFKDSPVYINTTLKDWHSEPGIPRRAGISSFGSSGTLAHLVLEEFGKQERHTE